MPSLETFAFVLLAAALLNAAPGPSNLYVLSRSIAHGRRAGLISALGLTEAEAMDLMLSQAFQQESEAKGKWRRATLSSVQLTSYFTGYKEIYDFREEMKATHGSDFNLKDFHNEFLSYGSSPVKYIKTMMRN